MKPMTPPRQTARLTGLVVLFVAITAFAIVGFSRPWLPPVASAHGSGVDGVIQYLLLTTGTVLVVGAAALIGLLWRYGRGQDTPSPVTSIRTERWWSVAPVLGMALIAEAGVLLKGLPVWKQVYGDPPEGAFIVEVTGQQFEWITRYPGADGRFGRTRPELVDQTANPAGLDSADPAGADDLVLRRALHLILDRPTHIRLRGRDVLHSFSVPAFRIKQDVVPGMIGGVNLTPTQAGEFEIACAELCGMGHYRMSGRVVVHPPADFDAWLASRKGPTP
jgi:cytochrome c oxidase subunit 2